MQPNLHILIISTSNSLKEFLGQWKEYAPVVSLTADIAEASSMVAQADIILLDLPLDKKDDDLSRFLAICGKNTPVIILKAATQSFMPVTASDNINILHKPLQAALLLESITSAIPAKEAAIPLCGLYFFVQERFLSRSDGVVTEQEKLKLTEKEVAILQFLYHHPNEIVEREKLLSEVWGYHADIDTHTLETHIYRLRQKIAESFNGKEIIITHSGGYSLRK